MPRSRKRASSATDALFGITKRPSYSGDGSSQGKAAEDSSVKNSLLDAFGRFHRAGPDLGRLQVLDRRQPPNRLARLLLRQPNLIQALQVQPELRAHSEEVRQPQRGVAGDGESR